MQIATGVFAPGRGALTVGILLSITAMACEGMAVSTVLPSIAVDLGGLGDYGWAFSAFMLASLVGAIAAGRSADRDDALSPARLGFASFAAGILVAGFAPVWPIFLVGRAVQGFGAGSLIAIAFVAVARGYPESLRPRLMALISSAWVVPSLVGPALAGEVAEHASWRLVFVGILPPVAAGAWMLLPRLGRLASSEAAPAPAASASVVGGSVAAESFSPAASAPVVGGRVAADSLSPNASARVVGDAGTATDPSATDRLAASLRLTAGVALALLAASLTFPLASAILGVVGLILALPALHSLLPRGTFVARGGLPAAVALRGLLAFGFFGAEALIPLGLTTQRGVPPSLVGLSLTASALAWVAGSWAQDRAEAAASGSVSKRAVRAAGGLLLVACGIAVTAMAILTPALPLELVVLAWALAGLGMGIAYPAATLTALGAAPSGQEGAAASALQVAETIGTAIGTGAAGALFALAAQFRDAGGDGLAWGFVLAAAAIVIGLAPALRLAPTPRWSEPPHTATQFPLAEPARASGPPG